MVLRKEWDGGTIALSKARERGEISRQYQHKLQVTGELINRLGLEKELSGHFGCVNCLEWNTDGSILASASDDQRVILWDPYRYKTLNTITTGHNGNIFSVKFMTPYLLATCAADSTVRIRDIAGISSQDSQEGSTVCSCHCSRVKRLATAPDCPSLVWSAGEDGFVMQHDTRVSHVCNNRDPKVLVNLLNHLGRFAEAKCLAINPRRPEQLAVGANDFYVRLYDRRMIKLEKLQKPSTDQPQRVAERQNYRGNRTGQGDTDSSMPRGCVQYFAPGHLATQQTESTLHKKSTTYLTFSSDGNELLVNLGSEQVYLFDINSHRRPVLLESYIIEHNHGNSKKCATSSTGNGFTVPMNTEIMKIDDDNGKNGTFQADMEIVSKEYVLPKKVKELKEQANDEMHKNNYTVAVQLYNQAISQCPECAVLYSNRAAALMRRKWAGDIYAAIRDCYTAINLDPQHVKSHFRLAKALMELSKAREARECLLYFKDKFPKYSNAHAVWLLQKDINLAMNKLLPGAEVESDESSYVPVSFLERQLRASCIDYSHRFLGHCNTTTDIKEANFLGQDGQFIVAGSDDGSFFIWSRKTGNIVRCLRGDDSIVNCIQVHPTSCLIATSGIESTVRLWSPRPEDGNQEPREVTDVPDVAQANQQRMRADPFEAMLLNITYRGAVGGQGREGGPNRGSGSPGADGAVTCRAS